MWPVTKGAFMGGGKAPQPDPWWQEMSCFSSRIKLFLNAAYAFYMTRAASSTLFYPCLTSFSFFPLSFKELGGGGG